MAEHPKQLGKYEIRGELGRGAMGIVYDGWDAGIGRRVALKTVRRDQLDGGEAEELLSRFKREAQAAGRLNHPGIVAVYEYGEDAGTAFIAMEFVEGRELKDVFDRNERFPLPEVVRIMSLLLEAIGHAHSKGIVHRDIKPANVFLLKDGRIKVGDFGIARMESSNLTQAGSVLGTPAYMSPEQFMGQTVDGRSDLFSAGVILYQFLTGERPDHYVEALEDSRLCVFDHAELGRLVAAHPAITSMLLVRTAGWMARSLASPVPIDPDGCRRRLMINC